MEATASDALTPEVLTQWRERMGYSKSDAATALGCSYKAWTHWEGGKHRIPRYIGLATAALALGIDLYAPKDAPPA